MAKRFTDTELWDREWFMSLSPVDKCAVSYIKDKCDCVGVWKPNFPLAEFYIKGKPNWKELPGKSGGNIKLLPNGKWFLMFFCEFQYGQLSPNCKPHTRYIQDLKKHGLYTIVMKVYKTGIGTVIDAIAEDEPAKKKKKIKIPPERDEVAKFIADNKYNVDVDAWFDFYISKGWKVGKTRMVDWKASVRQWNRGSGGKNSYGSKKSSSEYGNIGKKV